MKYIKPIKGVATWISAFAIAIALPIPVGAHSPLKLAGPSTVSIDPTSNSGSILLAFSYDLQQDTYSVNLNATDFTSCITGKLLSAKVTFSDQPDTPGKSSLKHDLKKGKGFWLVRVDVANVWEAGISETTLKDGQDEIATLRAAKYRFPFAVKLDVPTPDKPEISLSHWQHGSITFKNDDPLSYRFSWQLLINGKAFDSPKDLTLSPSPSGSSSVLITPPAEWFRNPLAGLFKDEESEGRLTVTFRGDGDTPDPFAPSKSILVKVHLRYWPTWVQQVFGYPIVFLTLLLGGVGSLMVNFGLPNKLSTASVPK